MDPIIEEEQIDEKFMDELERAGRLIYNQQSKFLQEMTEHYEKYKNNLLEYKYAIIQTQNKEMKNFMEKYPIKKIQKHKWIPSDY